jgi:ubiquinone/menaquinone biosynthesis C-methylase UbiE
VLEAIAVISRISPWAKRTLYWIGYQSLAALYPRFDWPFMNYGFAELEPHERQPRLSTADEKDRLYIQLYDHVVKAVDLGGLDVLEVGCGRGGGSAYIARYLKPRSVIGVDFSQNAIALCRRRHPVAGLTFLHAVAEALPFPANSFDVVVNVESSHCYGSMERFLAEAARVLRPKGHLLFADFRQRPVLATLREQVRASGFEILSEKSIRLNVLAALEADEDRKRALLHRVVPRLLRPQIRQFAGMRGTYMYNALRDGRIEYFSWLLRKPGIC